MPYSPRYFHCPKCDLRFLDPQYRLPAHEEEARYRTHNNDVTDPAYQNFVAPLYRAVSARIRSGDSGLDFGAGTGPVLAEMFERGGYPMRRYDPFFGHNPIGST